MLDMKIVVVLFCAAIKESGFPVTPLLDVLMELRFVRNVANIYNSFVIL